MVKTMIWCGVAKIIFLWNMDLFDFGLHFGGLFELKMVPKLTYGSHWGSQGHPLGVLGAGLDFIDF